MIVVPYALCSAGSWGDVNAPQLIIENRAVALDYARDEPPGAGHYGHGGPQGAPPGARGGGAPAKSDWLCDAVIMLPFPQPIL